MRELCDLDGVCAPTLTVGVAIVFCLCMDVWRRVGIGEMYRGRDEFNSVSPKVAPCDATLLRYV